MLVPDQLRKQHANGGTKQQECGDPNHSDWARVRHRHRPDLPLRYGSLLHGDGSDSAGSAELHTFSRMRCSQSCVGPLSPNYYSGTHKGKCKGEWWWVGTGIQLYYLPKGFCTEDMFTLGVAGPEKCS